MTAASLIVDALIVSRAGFRLPPLSVAAAPGSVVALIGPNGGGKTTLLKTLAGLLPPCSGTIAFGASGQPTAAYLPPPGSVSVGLPVAHVVALGRAARRGWSPVLSDADRQAAVAALDRLGIAELAARPFDAVSSGQQQLALMARLIVQQASLCLLDEPTALLDPPHAARVEHAMRVLTDAGHVVIASTHHLALAGRADQVIAVGPSLTIGKPGDMLSAARLSALYGAPLTLCPCCHQPISVTTVA